MSVNSSSFNESNALPHLSSSNSSSSSYIHCYISGDSAVISITYMIIRSSLLLPLSIFILYHGHPEWWQNHSTSPTSHSNCFTYHMVAMELIGVLGYIICCCGIFMVEVKAISVGNYLSSLTWYGEIYFHMLTCVERYLAVFHPITFLSLRNERGIRIRNVGIGCTWLLSCLALVGLMLEQFIIMDLCLLISALTVVSFCSFTVLRVLINPGPGEKVREGTDQSKRRAFHTILTILGVLLLRFVCNIIWEVVYLSGRLQGCVILTSITWSNLPTSLVLPLLYLHRAGKIVCRKVQRKSEKRRDLQTKTTSETSYIIT